MSASISSKPAHPLKSPTIQIILAIHLLALAAPFTFTWPGFIAFAVLYFATGCLGITLCYHRMLTHRSFKAPKPVKYFITLIACLALEGSPVWWVATHRLHHRESDQPLDPHSPVRGFWWSHVLWLAYPHPDLPDVAAARRLALDLHNDKGMRFFEKYYLHISLATATLLFGGGYLLGGWTTAISMLVWGGFLRIVCVWHITWLVNSATHIWGYQSYNTLDLSKNSMIIAFLTFGEGWHNNHHADQRAAKSGHLWHEFDLTYGIILLMKTFGLAYDIVPVNKKRISAPQEQAFLDKEFSRLTETEAEPAPRKEAVPV